MKEISLLIEKLKIGEAIQARTKGNSMKGKIEPGQLCTIKPIQDEILKKGDIVLCRVRRNIHLHLIKSIRNNQFQIGNNHGHINGWISIDNIFGICSKVED